MKPTKNRFWQLTITLLAAVSFEQPVTAQGVQQQLLPSEYATLVELFNAIGKTSWIKPDAPSWPGISIVDAKVISIALDGQSLAGTLPQSIGNFSGLTYLNVAGNELGGDIPSSLGNIATLNYLNISANEFDGSIPGSLGRLAFLHTLLAKNNQLTGSIPPALGGLQLLSTLDLSDNLLTDAIPATLGSLQSLENLNLSLNRLRGTIPNLSATRLRTLRVNQNQLGGLLPDSLGQLLYLQELDLSGNQFNGTLPPVLANISTLRSFRANDNLLIGSIPESYGNFRFMNLLDVGGNLLSGSIPSRLADMGYPGLAPRIYLLFNNFLTSEGTPNFTALQRIKSAGITVYDKPSGGGLYLVTSVSGEHRNLYTSRFGTVIKAEDRRQFDTGDPPFSPSSTLSGVYFSPWTQPPFDFSAFGEIQIESHFQRASGLHVADRDVRQGYLAASVAALYQFEGAWANSVMNPLQNNAAKRKTVRQIGCVLTCLAMAANYTERAPSVLRMLTDSRILDPVTGDLRQWNAAFRQLQSVSGDGTYQLVPATKFLSSTVSIPVGRAPANTDWFDSLERILRGMNAAAIIKVPSLSHPNEATKFHYVLCVGIEDDEIGGSTGRYPLPLKRLRIYDPGKRQFSRLVPNGTSPEPIRYLDQHFHPLLRSSDYLLEPSMTVRYFLVPTTGRSEKLIAASEADKGSSISYTVPEGVTALISRNGQPLDLSAMDVVTHFDSVDDPNDPSFPGTPGLRTTYILAPPPGSYSIVFSNVAPDEVGRTQFVMLNEGEPTAKEMTVLTPPIGSISSLQFSISRRSTPHLSISQTTSNTLVVEWPTDSDGCVLQKSGDLNSNDWTEMTATPTITNSLKQVTIPKAEASLYFRLYCQ